MAVSRPRKGSLQFVPIKRSKRKPTFSCFKEDWPLSQIPGVKLGMLSYTYSLDDKTKIISPSTLIQLPVKANLRMIYDNSKSIKLKDFKIDQSKKGYLCEVTFRFNGQKKDTKRLFLNNDLIKSRDLVTNQVDLSLIFDTISKTKMVDVVGRTKGKGFQGIVKRRGTKIKKRKHFRTAKKRLIGSQGCFTPGITSWRTPMAGQMGNANRVVYNLENLPISYLSQPENYDNLKNTRYLESQLRNYLVVKGSVPGPTKSIFYLRRRFREKQ
jgi:ribosomal protein L3